MNADTTSNYTTPFQHISGEQENNAPLFHGLTDLESPTPVKQHAQKGRKPRKSVAPKKLLLGSSIDLHGPPPAGSLRRSSRKREHAKGDDDAQSDIALLTTVPISTLPSQLKVLKVSIPSDTDFTSYKISMTADNDLITSNTDDQGSFPTCTEQHQDDDVDDGDHIRRVSNSPPSLQRLLKNSPSATNFQQSYSSPVPMNHMTATTFGTTSKNSPPKSILRSKKKPRLTTVADTCSDVHPQVDGMDAQLYALVTSTNRMKDVDGATPPTTPTASVSVDETTGGALQYEKQEDSESDFDAVCIQNRMSLLFPNETFDTIKRVPCILPRLIACFTLYRDEETMFENGAQHSGSSNKDPRTPKVTTRRRKRSLDSKTKSIKDIAPIRALFSSLVDLELCLLSIRGADAHLCTQTTFESLKDDRQSPHTNNKRVMFQAFDTMDGSAVLCPPTDTLEGSYQEQEQFIQQLSNVLKTVESLEGWQITEVMGSLQDFATYLDGIFRLRYHDKMCAATVSLNGATSSYPTSRISKAAAAYSRDIESLLGHLSPLLESTVLVKGGTETSRSTSPPRPPLVWEMRLSDASAQLTRYWLRTLINSVPERYEKNRNNSRAWKRRLDDLIQMHERPGREGDEDPTSSLVSNALSHIHSYLGANLSEWQQRLSKHLAVLESSADTAKESSSRLADLCASEICQTGVGKSRSPAEGLTESEWLHVWENFDSASALIACYSRAVFIDQLLSIVAELKLDKQWSKTVQRAARPLTDLSVRDSVLQASGMTILQPEDAHLALLGWDLELLRKSLQDVLLIPLCDEIEVVQKNLLSSASAFRLGGGKKKSKHFNAHLPHIGVLEEHWLDHLEPSLAFCTMRLKSETEEDC